ncbi:hypothetical protein DYL61_14515 [Pseudomonas nabeulensis]|uniref:Uncharacterized protein n=1 Tax=Pseudomonas nabeulensis TaxID=2293833 RepID=A0A4Z0B414_9PSED|nr:hypothetical protein [Pseudomonas nabeulensis]TFY93323.1 hypothetical protein DYL61_14515 [Pseudomonas nabeulensis]
MLNLTVQIYSKGKWQDAMLLTFDTPENGFESRCSFGYDQQYLVDHFEQGTAMGGATGSGVGGKHRSCC